LVSIWFFSARCFVLWDFHIRFFGFVSRAHFCAEHLRSRRHGPLYENASTWLRTWTIGVAADCVGVAATSSHALPGHGRFGVDRHFALHDHNCCNVSLGSPDLVRRPSFSLRRHTLPPPAADGHRSVAPPLRQWFGMLGSHSARALWSRRSC